MVPSPITHVYLSCLLPAVASRCWQSQLLICSCICSSMFRFSPSMHCIHSPAGFVFLVCWFVCWLFCFLSPDSPCASCQGRLRVCCSLPTHPTAKRGVGERKQMVLDRSGPVGLGARKASSSSVQNNAVHFNSEPMWLIAALCDPADQSTGVASRSSRTSGAFVLFPCSLFAGLVDCVFVHAH